MSLTLHTNTQTPLSSLFNPNHKLTSSPKWLSLLVMFLTLSWHASAQFSENHNYVLGGSLRATNDLDFINLRAGRVLNNENILGLSLYADHESFSGISAWYRIVKELEVISLPIFYKMDAEIGYFDDESIGLFFSPGFMIPLTKRSYLDLSIAAVRLNYESELETLISLNNVGIGLVFGL